MVTETELTWIIYGLYCNHEITSYDDCYPMSYENFNDDLRLDYARYMLETYMPDLIPIFEKYISD